MESISLDQELLDSVFNGDLKKVKVLLFEGVNTVGRVVSKKDDFSRYTPLTLAVEKEDVEIVKSLLRTSGVDVNQKDHYGNTALHKASSKGNVDVMKVLLATETIDVNIENTKYDYTPLHFVKGNHVELLQTLLQVPGILVNKKDTHGKTALHHLASDQYEEAVKVLLKVPGILVNEKEYLHGNTPLHLAADFRHAEAVKALLKHPDIDVNVKDKYGQTPLHTSAYHGDLKVVEMLLEAGINANVEDNNGFTAAQWAVKHDYFHRVVGMIVNHIKHTGACVNLVAASRQVGDLVQRKKLLEQYIKQENDLYNQLLIAVEKRDLTEVGALVVQPFVLINYDDSKGPTVLQLAAKEGYEEIVKMLLTHPDINVNSRCTDGQFKNTPLYLAVESGNLETVDALLNHPHVSVNAKSTPFPTPLQRAAELGHLHIRERLLKAGAKEDETNSWGQTLLDFAGWN